MHRTLTLTVAALLCLMAGQSHAEYVASATADLLRACERGDAAEIQVELEAGADPNGRNDVDRPAIFLAAASGSADAVRLLLNAGATAVNEAHLQRGSPTTPLALAAYHGDLATVTALLAKGADIGVRGVPNATLWLRDALSASVAHPAVCRYLLERGISPYMRDSAGFSPLHSAAGEGSPECIKLIVEHGVDPNLRSRGGDTPLKMARNRLRPPAVIAALHEAGATD